MNVDREPSEVAPTSLRVRSVTSKKRGAGALTLILSRMPTAGDANVAELVSGGSLAFEIIVNGRARAEFFARVEARLLFRGKPIGQAFLASGQAPRIAMAVAFTQAVARAAIDASTGRASELDVEVRATRGGTVEVQRTPLTEVLGDNARSGLVRISLVARDEYGMTVEVPRRIAARVPRFDGVERRSVLAALGREVVAADRIVDPRATAMVKVRPPQLDDTVLITKPISAPVITADAATWPDATDKLGRWYVPQYAVVVPAPNATADASPFAFIVDGNEATMRFVVAPVPWTGGRIAPRPVPPLVTAIALVIPFVDSRTGRPAADTFECTVARDGDRFVATCRVANDWVRICYAALSNRRDDGPRARVVIKLGVRAVIPLHKPILGAGGKTALVPIKARDGALYFDARARAVRAESTEIAFRRELGAVRPVATRPILVPPPELEAPGLTGPHTFARTFTCTREAPIRFPCNQFGQLYVRRASTGDVAIGCDDAFALGTIRFQAYEELPAFASASYRVLRSLQRPERVLVVPARMRISRHAATSGDRAFRPAILVYCALDADSPEGARIVFDATLEPDVPVFERRHLLEKLRAVIANPVLEFPSEVAVSSTFHWVVDHNIDCEVEAFAYDAHLVRVSIKTHVTGAVLVRSIIERGGLLGTWDIALSDGQPHRITLHIDLENIAGPWETGPVEVTPDGARARLTNRIEGPVDVHALRVETAGQPATEVRVARQLARGETIVTDGPATGATCVYTTPPLSGVVLEEARSFIEEIRLNVIFIDQLDRAARRIDRLEVAARLADVEGTQQAIIGTEGVAELEFLLPLTRYLNGRVLEFQITLALTNGTIVAGPWHRWDLAASGSIVGITAQYVP